MKPKNKEQWMRKERQMIADVSEAQKKKGGRPSGMATKANF